MPWKVGKKTMRGFPIIKKDTNEIVGYSQTLDNAKASIRARYANANHLIKKSHKK